MPPEIGSEWRAEWLNTRFPGSGSLLTLLWKQREAKQIKLYYFLKVIKIQLMLYECLSLTHEYHRIRAKIINTLQTLF